MAKSKNQEETRTSIDNLNDSLISVGSKIKDNKKSISIATCCVAAVVIGVCIYIFGVRNPRIKAANERVGVLEVAYLANPTDSLTLENLKAEALANDEKSGHQLRLLAAQGYYDKGNYEEALNLLNDYDVDDEIIGACALSLKGDCLVNLGKSSDAVAAFEEAIEVSDENAHLTPYFMHKIANIYAYEGDYGKEYDMLAEISAKYPAYEYGTSFPKSGYYNAAQNYEHDRKLETARLRAGK